MIIGIGNDIAEVSRIKKSVENDAFKKRVFSASEISYCESKANGAESFAARFAAKEAFFKAVGTGWRGGMSFNEVEVRNDELGKPTIHLLGETAKILSEKRIRIIHVSLSHVKEVAMATVVLEG